MSDTATTPQTTPATADRPAWRHMPSVVLFVALAGGTLAADLWLKAWSFADPVLVDHGTRDLVPAVLSLRLTTNHGAVFGLGQGAQVFFIGVSLVATVVIGILFARSKATAWAYHVGLAVILAGALGNLYDRVRFGYVRDMLWLLPDVPLPMGWSWPNGNTDVYPWIFNIADVGLVVGVGVMVVVMWLGDRQPRPEPTAAA